MNKSNFDTVITAGFSGDPASLKTLASRNDAGSPLKPAGTTGIYIGLGANLGNPSQTIFNAITKLNQLPNTRVARCSSLYLSPPLDADGDDYLNAVVEIHTQLDPTELLSALQKLETQFGRTRDYVNAPRTLDLDLLLYEQRIINTASLQIPHPRMTQRAFVLMPLLEIAPNVMIPNHGAAHTLLARVQNQTIQKTGKTPWPTI